MTQLFQVLDTPESSRSRNLDEDLARFPYVNGELFGGSLRIPSFTSGMRQNRKDSHRRAELRKFQERLGTRTFFDPACGCGNFLIIGYRELRALEIEVLAELRRYTGQDQMELDATELSVVNVDQFYGIEFDEFPARIAETALWMMDHIKNNRLSLEFGESYVRIPLQRSPHILHADALETDWSLHVPSSSCSYVLGNPPFVGAKFQSETQRSQVRRIAALGRSGGTLDYVAAWFIKAAHYIQNTSAKIGFAATNSLTQGEQVAQLWPLLFDWFGLEIEFAHRTCAWGPDARGKAHVHVVILGLCLRAHASKVRRLFTSKVRRLFIYDDINGEPHESAVASITPYLIDGTNLHDPNVVVAKCHRGGHYIFDRSEADAFLSVWHWNDLQHLPDPAHRYCAAVHCGSERAVRARR